MLVGVFGDSHARAEVLDAVLGAADACGVEELSLLGDKVRGGPDPECVVERTRERCTIALPGNHATARPDPSIWCGWAEPGSPGERSLEPPRERLSGADLEWLRLRKPAARRDGVQCWHGGPRDAVREYVGASNAGACLAAQRAELGVVGHSERPSRVAANAAPRPPRQERARSAA